MIDPNQKTNAGKRLYAILEAIKTNNPQAQGNRSIADSLCAVFKVRLDDLAALYTRFASLLTLIDDVENRLNSLDDSDRDLYLKCFVPIKRAFQSNAMQNSSDVLRNSISDSDLALLKLASQRLDSVQFEILLPASDIDALQVEVSDLSQKVLRSDLTPELRIILLDLLEGIRRTLSEYQIRGAEGLKRALAECMGRLRLDMDIVVRENQKPEMKSFLDLLSRLNTLFTAATNSGKAGAFLGEVIARITG